MKLTLNLRDRQKGLDSTGCHVWEENNFVEIVEADQTALLICDVWDNHWSRGARERLDTMIPRMANVVEAARSCGIKLIHSPSDTMDFYVGSTARARIKGTRLIDVPEELLRDDPILPIDDSDGGSDTSEETQQKVWIRQHSGIFVDESLDVISDNGSEIYSYLRKESIQKLLIMGVHTNMCVLHRSFGIKQMVKWGVDVTLIRDLTDTMYNPLKAPYVSHEEGTELVIKFIEAFWCPSMKSDDLI